MKAISFKTAYAQAAPWALPLLAILFIISLVTCNRNRGALGDLRIDFDSVARQATQFENANGQLITENGVLKAESSEQLEALTDTIFKLKKKDQKQVKALQSYTRIIQEFTSGPKLATYTDGPDYTQLIKGDSGGAVAACRDSNYMRVPKPFMYMDSMTFFSGRVTRVGVWVDSIKIDNTVHFRILTEKTGFLNLGKKSTLQVLNTNKAIKTIGATTVQVPTGPTWWHRWGKPVTFAILAGIAGHQLAR